MREDLRQGGEPEGDVGKVGPDRIALFLGNRRPVSGFDAVFDKVIELPDEERLVECAMVRDAAVGRGGGGIRLNRQEGIDRF